jgi:O-antigen/teichoic acid export membrane protein
VLTFRWQTASSRGLWVRATSSSLVRNSGFIMATTIVNSGLGFVFWTIAARSFQPSVVGLAAAIVAAMSVTSLICGVGSDAVVIAFLPSRNPGSDWSRTLHAALLVGASASLAGAILVTALLPKFSAQFAVLSGVVAFSFAICTVAWTLSTVLDATFVAERTARYMLVRNSTLAVGKLLLLALAVIFVHASWLSIFLPWVSASVLSVVIAFLLLPRLRRGYTAQFNGLPAEIRKLSSRFAGHHLIGLTGALPPLILPVLVTARLSSAQNAYFYATWMVGGVFFVVSPAVASALFAEGSHERVDLPAKIRTSAKFILCLLAPLSLVYLVCGQFVLGLFGERYASEGWPVLLLLLASALPDAVTNIYVSVMRVYGRLARAGALNAAIAATTVVLAWVLLPDLGIKAAALAWLVAQMLGTLAVATHILGAQRQQRRPGPGVPGGVRG